MTQVEDEALPNVGVWGLHQDGRQRSISLELLDDACVPPIPASANSSGSRPAPASQLEEKRYPFQRGRKVSQSSIGSLGADPETRNPVPVVSVGADPSGGAGGKTGKGRASVKGKLASGLSLW